MENKPALDYLQALITCSTHRMADLKQLIEISHTAFCEYVVIRDYLKQLQLLYYKLTDKEYKE